MSNAPYMLQGRALGLPHGQRRVDRQMLAEGLTCAIKGCHMGDHGRGDRQALRRLARRPGCLRGRESARAEAPPSRPVRSTARSSPSKYRRRRGRRVRVDEGRVSARRDDGGEARGAEASLRKGRHRHRRQRVRASTTARRRWSIATEEKAKSSARKPLARILVVLHDRRRSEDHGHGTGRSDAQGAASAPG